MKDCNLSSWLYQKRCFLTKDSELPITHLCLDGGRLHIPDRLIQDFFVEYSKGILSGEKYFICETPSSVIKMFCDFDYVADEQVTSHQLENWSRICRKVVMDTFGRHYDFVICVSASKSVQKNKRKQIKSGVHFIWKDLFVSTSVAHQLALRIIGEFNETFPNVEWKEYIDVQVYTNGLRMVGSRKMVMKKRKIREVSDESTTPQTQKNDYETIKVDEGREYVPHMYVSSSGVEIPEEDQLCYYNLRQLKQIMADTCIRTYNNEKSIDPIGELPELLKVKKKSSSNRKTDTDIEDPRVVDRVEAFIRYQTIVQWNSPLRQLRKHDKFYIAKIDSMYCLNVQREHNSCGIYFQITEHGMYQRCFCKCDTEEGRLSGKCDKFKSAPFPLPMEVLKMLFPKSNTKAIARRNQNKIKPTKELFASNTLLKSRETLSVYLNMSMNTIMEIEKKIMS